MPEMHTSPDRTDGGRRRKKPLFKDSNSAAKSWWASDLNQESDWETAPATGARHVWWRCPECGHVFEAKVNDMSRRPSCDPCSKRRLTEARAQEKAWATTMVSEIPELLARWDDTADPSTVAVYHEWQYPYRFRCPEGHRRTKEPHIILTSPCPSCSAEKTRTRNTELRKIDDSEASLNPEIRAQWHPIRNGDLRPEHVGPRSKRTIWWQDPACGHEWQETPLLRGKNYRFLCPACETKVGSLAALHPELAEQWSPSNPTTPWHVLPYQSLDFTPTWICPQDPSHIWHASNVSRVTGSQCPQCKVYGKSQIETDVFEAILTLDSTATSGTPVRSDAFRRRQAWHPDVLAADGTAVLEFDGAYWHRDKTGIDREKSLDLLAAGIAVFRVREHPLPLLGIDDIQYRELVTYTQVTDVEEIAHEFCTWVTGLSER